MATGRSWLSTFESEREWSHTSNIEGGPVIHPDTVRRLLCEARTQTIVEDGSARPLGLGG
jgi:hypothetical protein